jgi:hypothetical protein
MYEDYDRFADDDYVGLLAGKLAKQKRREARGEFDEDGHRGRRGGRRNRRADRRRRDDCWG